MPRYFQARSIAANEKSYDVRVTSGASAPGVVMIVPSERRTGEFSTASLADWLPLPRA
jgi:hypothetical protein